MGTTRRAYVLAPLLSTWLVAACGNTGSAVVAPTDAGTAVDAGAADTGTAVDASSIDAADTATDAVDAPGTADTTDAVTDAGPPPCARDTDCAGDPGGSACDTATGRCVRCVADAHCPAGQLCVGQLCVVGCSAGRPCPSGERCCDGACVDPQSNVAHCGACNARCAVPNATSACMNGACAVAMCTTPFADCDRDATNGCETSTQSSTAHCGGCGMACAARPNAVASCAAGSCRYECAAGYADCDGDAANGCEVDTRTSLTHCGACARPCAPPNAAAACAAGACTVARCNDGYGDCDVNATNGCEASLRSSVDHCGGCGRACATQPNAVPACSAGACSVTCAAGFADCDGDAPNGCETDTRTSATHCGACGRTCALANATSTCRASLCAVDRCADPYADCDGNAANGCETDPRTSAAHCGACGRACGAGEACSAGTCVGADGPLVVNAGSTRSFEALTVSGVVTSVRGAEVATPDAARFRVDDEVMVIDLQGRVGDVVGVGAHEFARVRAVGSGALTVSPPPALAYGASNDDLSGQRVFVVRVPHFTDATIDGTLTTARWGAARDELGVIAFRASGRVRVGAAGFVDVTGRGYRSDGVTCNGTSGRPGESVVPQPPMVGTFGQCNYASPSALANRGGGGGGLSDCEVYSCTTQLVGAGGGGGGHGAAGSPGLANGALHRAGAGGEAVGAVEVERWFLGSGGGAGAGGVSGPGYSATTRGRGGGLVFVSAPVIEVAGSVIADGERGGENDNCGGRSGSGSGGGGAGGTIVLQGGTLTLATVRAAGGAGGCAGGGAGGIGRIRVEYRTLNGAAFPGGSATATTPPAFLAPAP